MQLTTAQKQTLNADIIAAADADCAALEASPDNSDLAFAVASLYNQPAAVDHWVWTTSLTKHAAVSETSVDATTFSFTQLIARTVQEQFGWQELWNSTLSCNPSLPNVRQGFADVFSGAQAGPLAQRTHLLAMARRKATRVEKLLATGTGSTAVPAVMGSEGPLTFQNVLDAMDS
jgi:hypothetical protein